MFLHYLAWRLQKIESVSSVIKERVRWDFLDFANETVFPSKAELPRDLKMARWVLFDSPNNGPPIGLWPSVLVTSPKYVACFAAAAAAYLSAIDSPSGSSLTSRA